MHSGQDTDFYLKKGFKVVAVEANPKLCDEGKVKNLPTIIKTGRLTIVNKGISKSSYKSDYFMSMKTKSVWSFF